MRIGQLEFTFFIESEGQPDFGRHKKEEEKSFLAKREKERKNIDVNRNFFSKNVNRDDPVSLIFDGLVKPDFKRLFRSLEKSLSLVKSGWCEVECWPDGLVV